MVNVMQLSRMTWSGPWSDYLFLPDGNIDAVKVASLQSLQFGVLFVTSMASRDAAHEPDLRAIGKLCQVGSPAA